MNKNINLNVEDFKTICRFCLLNIGQQQFSLSSEEISNMLKDCTYLQMYCDEKKLPQQICVDCYWKLKHTYDFKQQCSFSMEILCDILLKEDHEKNENSNDIDPQLFIKTELNGGVNEECKAEEQEIEIIAEECDYNDTTKLKTENFNENSSVDDNKDDDDISLLSGSDDEDENESKRKSLINILIKKYNIYDLTCNICNKEICTRQTLLRHMKTHDKNRTQKYKCDLCGKKFFESRYLEKHFKRHLGQTKYQCEYCPKQYYELTAIGVHYKQTHKIKPFICVQCNVTFNHPLQLKQHEQSVHELKEFICDLCGKKFNMKYRLKEHQSVHSDEKPYSCKYCNSQFKQNDNLQTHIRLKHIDKDRREMCFICGILLRPGRMGRHLASHEENKTHKCELCDRTYNHKYILRQHMRNTHLKDAKKYYCDICDKSLSSKTSLTQHMSVMHSNTEDNRRVECHICGQVYKRLSSVKIHIQSAHMDQRPHVCGICKKAFHTRSKLKNHIRTHTGERPFACKICGKAYGWRELLTNHTKKVHSNVQKT